MVSVRAARESDIEAIRAVGDASRRAAYGSHLDDASLRAGFDAWWRESALWREIRDGTGLVALVPDGALVGVLTAARLESGEHVIWKLYVHPGHQRQGVGGALVRAFLERVDGDGRDVVLEHYAFNAPAATFYEPLGFHTERTELSELERLPIVWRRRPANPGTVAFYDGLATDYHLIYGDRWEAAVDRQGAALARLIAGLAPGARTVLDCSCGIGTQAIGLARAGYRVTGSDVSEAALQRARREARQLGAEVGLARADFRDLSALGGGFDVVLSADHAVPHMLTAADVTAALRGMREALAPGGLLLVSTRDYDAAMRERTASAPPTLIAGPPRRVVVRLHDWDGADSPLHTVRFLVLTEGEAGWTVVEHGVRYRAVTAQELAAAAMNVGLEAVRWHSADTVGFHQPVMSARRP